MPRYVALLRGVSPQSLQMAELRSCLERAGFENVRTVLSSGNAVFDGDARPPADLEAAVESAMTRHLGRRFYTIVRPVPALQALLASDPFAGYGLPEQARRVVSFLRAPRQPRCALPLTEGTATVIRQVGAEVYTAYLPGPKGPVFMKLIERAYGADITTRTWETVARCAAA